MCSGDAGGDVGASPAGDPEDPGNIGGAGAPGTSTSGSGIISSILAELANIATPQGVVTTVATAVNPMLGILTNAVLSNADLSNPGEVGPASEGNWTETETQRPVRAPVYSTPTATTSAEKYGVIAPTTNANMIYGEYKPRTPEQIDADNRLRREREQAYAEQKATSESELLKSLALRDVNYSDPNARLSEPTTAAERFVGTPPALGQSRHRWA